MAALYRSTRGSRTRRRRSAFTLVEMLLALLLTSLVVTATASIIVVSSRALDTAVLETEASEVEVVLADMTLDLRLATSFSERTDSAVTFEVPDRDGDGNPETIRYAWGGNDGDPLTRQYNGGKTVTLLRDLKMVKLRYLERAIDGRPGGSGGGGGGGTESAEMLLASHDPGTFSNTQPGEINMPSLLGGQYLDPTFPPDTLSWKITRVIIMGRHRGAPGGDLQLQIRTANPDGTPSSTIVASTTFAKNLFNWGWTWAEISLSGADGLDPAQNYCLVVEQVVGNAGADIRGQAHGGAYNYGPEGHLVYSTDGGSSWTVYDNMDLFYFLYGTVTTK
ncbi:MAG: prepilin-type N-terminal cleavage/methylation domain-containing protein [Phycisphaerales bacterium]